jgi:hypothetical protein
LTLANTCCNFDDRLLDGVIAFLHVHIIDL